MLVSTACGAPSKSLTADDLVGRWKCELYGSELVIEFTDDGRFISHTDMSENFYRIENEMLVTYVDGIPDSEVAMSAKVNDEKLVLGGLEYTRLDRYSSP